MRRPTAHSGTRGESGRAARRISGHERARTAPSESSAELARRAAFKRRGFQRAHYFARKSNV